MKRLLSLSLLCASFVVGGCETSPPTPTKDKPANATTAISKAAGATPKPAPGPRHPGLLDPSLANEQAPANFRAKFTTSKGAFVIEVTREWAPVGADRFYNLVRVGFFTDVIFFRVIGGFMAQFGINGDPIVSKAWARSQLQDETVETKSNARGTISFAKTNAPNSRSTQLFINFGDNSRLDKMKFAPIGRVVEGMDVVDALHKDYGAAPSSGQAAITRQGNAWLHQHFPELDHIQRAEIVK